MVDVQGTNWRSQLSPSLLLLPQGSSRRWTVTLALLGALLCLVSVWQAGRAAAAESAAASALHRAEDIQRRTDAMAKGMADLESQVRALTSERTQMAETLQKKDAAFAAAKERVTELKQELHHARHRRSRRGR